MPLMLRPLNRAEDCVGEMRGALFFLVDAPISRADLSVRRGGRLMTLLLIVGSSRDNNFFPFIYINGFGLICVSYLFCVRLGNWIEVWGCLIVKLRIVSKLYVDSLNERVVGRFKYFKSRFQR